MPLLRTLSIIAGAFSAGVGVGVGAYAAVSSPHAPALTATVAPSSPPPDATPASTSEPSAAPEPLDEPVALTTSERAVPEAPLVDVCGQGYERRLCTRLAEPPPSLAWLLGLRAPELPVHASNRVERFFRFLTENPVGRRQVRAWLERSRPHRGAVQRVLMERGLPPDLEAVVAIESGYAPHATSRNGAAGLWQFMPATAKAYGLSVSADLDERRGVTRSTEAAAHYLEDLDRRFGSWELALAAYDMGYGRLAARLRSGPSRDYWTMSAAPGALPEEVAQYVPRVLAVALLLRNLGAFGFDEPGGEPSGATADLDVPGGTPLGLVARAAGTSVVRLRELNPELVAGRLPGRDSAITVHVPSSAVPRAAAMLPRLLAPARPGEERFTVDDAFDWGTDELPPRGSTGTPPVSPVRP